MSKDVKFDTNMVFDNEKSCMKYIREFNKRFDQLLLISGKPPTDEQVHKAMPESIKKLNKCVDIENT